MSLHHVRRPDQASYGQRQSPDSQTFAPSPNPLKCQKGVFVGLFLRHKPQNEERGKGDPTAGVWQVTVSWHLCTGWVGCKLEGWALCAPPGWSASGRVAWGSRSSGPTWGVLEALGTYLGLTCGCTDRVYCSRRVVQGGPAQKLGEGGRAQGDKAPQECFWGPAGSCSPAYAPTAPPTTGVTGRPGQLDSRPE